MTRPIIIDTDPGQDDAVAILLALASPELDVLGISAVAGNVPLPLTARNARMICGLAGRPEVPVHAGCARPLARELHTAEEVHGRSGLDGADLPPPSVPPAGPHAVEFIIHALRTRPAGEVTLCTLGPLTNVAAALAMAPDIAPRIRELVMMGGACRGPDNVTPAAEFNIHVDPEAARAVLRAGVPVVMMPLDLTRQARVTRARREAFRHLGNRSGQAVAGMMEFQAAHRRPDADGDGPPLHDPTVIAWLLAPHLFTGRRMNVEVETAGHLTAGMTVCDWWGVTGRPPNALVMERIDDEGFFTLLTERLASLP